MRASVDGKGFRLGDQKFFPKGVSYGPFAPSHDPHEFLKSPSETALDFKLIQALGANLVRLYTPPPRWFLDLALEHQLRVFVDIFWRKSFCFLEDRNLTDEAHKAVRTAVRACCGHPAVFAFSVVNEIPADIVRWCRPDAVETFIDELIGEAKSIDPQCLCTFANFPPTEFLHPENIDFVTFNVYLHQRRAFENYLGRLQMLADTKPLVLGEFGIDSLREGEAAKCSILGWQVEAAFRAGLAGAILFTFTDEWFKEGREITDWDFGVTDRARRPKPSFEVIRHAFEQAPFFPLPWVPRISVVVACFNGARTLKACLESLLGLNYPDYEVILVDDGSTDTTPEIAALFPKVRCIRQTHQGLSVARNTGIGAATGELIAFTDADCRADSNWLRYLAGDLLQGDFAGIGGHNFLPPDDSAVAAAVMASPGGPAHVMLTDRIAEHIPGCNMLFYRWALNEIGGFDPIFRCAGDDVDVCWRLQQKGYKLGFCPASFVWHYRRSTVAAFIRQQQGYGEAETLLVRKHPENFNLFGGSIWKGHIYGHAKTGLITRRPIIYHGLFGTGFFQTLYQPSQELTLMLCTSLEYHFLVTLPLLVLSVTFTQLLPLALTSLLVSCSVCVAAAVQANLPKTKRRFWSRPLVAWLFLLQPIVRGWARYQVRIAVPPNPPGTWAHYDALQRTRAGPALKQLCYRPPAGVDRVQFLKAVLLKLDEQGWQIKADEGWSEHDVEVFGNRWSYVQISTASEGLGEYLIRCRLRTRWSLPAMMVIGSALGFELLVIGFVASALPWLWLLLLSVPAFGLWLNYEKRTLHKIITALMDETSRELGMTRHPIPTTPSAGTLPSPRSG